MRNDGRCEMDGPLLSSEVHDEFENGKVTVPDAYMIQFIPTSPNQTINPGVSSFESSSSIFIS